MYRKDDQHLRPVACPCVTVLVVVGDGGFAALRVGRYDFIDGRAKVGVGVGYDFGNGMLLGSLDSFANRMPMGEPITAAAAPMTIASTNTTPPAPSRASSDCATCRTV